jgi:ribosomal protein S18 acetylase RimI-like enzyme
LSEETISFTIRPAVITDAPAIADVHVSTWRDAYAGIVPAEILAGLDAGERAAFWRDVLEQEHSVLVCVDEGKVFGFCSLIPSRDEDAAERSTAEIASLYVRAASWRRGVGSALCASAFDLAQAAGFSAVTLWVLAENRAARGFYEKVGFEPDGATKVESAAGGPLLQELRLRKELPATCVTAERG